jgi:hypothetical protein
MRRLPALLASIGIVALALGLAPAEAGNLPTYTFTNTSGGPVARADFEILPAGSVSPPVIGTDPSTGLPKTASPVTLVASQSSGFDPNNFSTALGTGTGVEGLRLLFGEKQVIQNGQVTFEPVSGPNGAAPQFLDNGGTVTFTLNPDPAFQGAIQLISLTKGVPDPTLVPDTSGNGGGGGSGSGGGGSGDGSDPNIPEPVTILLWSSAIGLGALRARRAGR